MDHQYSIQSKNENDELILVEGKISTGGDPAGAASIDHIVQLTAGKQKIEHVVSVSVDPAEPSMSIKFSGRDPIEQTISDELLNDAPVDAEADDEWFQWLDRLIEGGQSITDIIETIPVPDPMFGCVLKAALLASAKQAIDCLRAIDRDDTPRGMRRQFFDCLRRHGLKVVGNFFWRTGRCWVSLL